MRLRHSTNAAGRLARWLLCNAARYLDVQSIYLGRQNTRLLCQSLKFGNDITSDRLLGTAPGAELLVAYATSLAGLPNEKTALVRQ